MLKKLANPKLHLVVLAITLLAEWVGAKQFKVGPGIILLLPMLYAIIIGALLTNKNLKLFNLEDSKTASPIITIAIFFLIAKIGVTIGPNIMIILKSGPALVLQEFGNALKTFIALPVGLFLGLNRELIGATHSIDREPNVALIIERFGANSPEGFGVLGVYIMGTLFGTVFLGLFAAYMASVTPLHPYALAMACGVGSGSMMAAASGSLAHIFPDMEQQIIAYAGASNLLSLGLGIYLSIFIYLPLAEWLYKVLRPILGRKAAS